LNTNSFSRKKNEYNNIDTSCKTRLKLSGKSYTSPTIKPPNKLANITIEKKKNAKNLFLSNFIEKKFQRINIIDVDTPYNDKSLGKKSISTKTNIEAKAFTFSTLLLNNPIIKPFQNINLIRKKTYYTISDHPFHKNGASKDSMISPLANYFNIRSPAILSFSQ